MGIPFTDLTWNDARVTLTYGSTKVAAIRGDYDSDTGLLHFALIIDGPEEMGEFVLRDLLDFMRQKFESFQPPYPSAELMIKVKVWFRYRETIPFEAFKLGGDLGRATGLPVLMTAQILGVEKEKRLQLHDEELAETLASEFSKSPKLQKISVKDISEHERTGVRTLCRLDIVRSDSSLRSGPDGFTPRDMRVRELGSVTATAWSEYMPRH